MTVNRSVRPQLSRVTLFRAAVVQFRHQLRQRDLSRFELSKDETDNGLITEQCSCERFSDSEEAEIEDCMGGSLVELRCSTLLHVVPESAVRLSTAHSSRGFGGASRSKGDGAKTVGKNMPTWPMRP